MVSLRKIARRTFLTGAVALAGGVAVGYYYYNKEAPNPLLGDGTGDAVFNPYVKIAPDNKITIIAPRAEMGQGISTTLAALVAEELDVSLSMITVEHGPASDAYFNRAMLVQNAPVAHFDKSFGSNAFRTVMGVASKFLSVQATGSSSSTLDGFEKMRHAGAVARHLLLKAASAKLGVDATALKTENGTIIDPASNKRLTYGEIAHDAATLPVPADVALRDPATWKILGKSQPRVDMLPKVTGAPIFGIDIRLPDMLYATVRMNPRLGGKMTSMDPADAKKITGVQEVIALESQTGNGFAVLANDTWAAFKGADAVKVEWGEAPYPSATGDIMAILDKDLATGSRSVMSGAGDMSSALNSNGPIIEAKYSVPHLAHATMEPMNATAQFKDGVLQVWAGIQAPSFVRTFCAKIAGIDADKVQVHTTHLGGGFGRRFEIDFSIYATLVAMKTGGKPVKVTWSREEDLTHGPYRPASVAHFKAKLGPDGIPVALEAVVAASSIVESFLKRTYSSVSPMTTDASIVDGSFNQPYAIPNFSVAAVTAAVTVPVGFWRSVGNSTNGFFHESFMDEIATAAKLDPVALRLKLMESYPTAYGAVAKAAEMSNWAAAKVEGRAKGIAFTLSFGSWVAMVVEVADTPLGIKIENVWAAADVGRALDPDIIKAQISSAAIFGLSAAMNQEITFADGMVEQKNFNDFDAMRMWQCPKFDIAILETAEDMGGVGEIGTPPAAPALANAVFALTGKRIRHLPLSSEVKFA